MEMGGPHFSKDLAQYAINDGNSLGSLVPRGTMESACWSVVAKHSVSACGTAPLRHPMHMKVIGGAGHVKTPRCILTGKTFLRRNATVPTKVSSLSFSTPSLSFSTPSRPSCGFLAGACLEAFHITLQTGCRTIQRHSYIQSTFNPSTALFFFVVSASHPPTSHLEILLC